MLSGGRVDRILGKLTGVLFFSADIHYESALKLKEEQLRETIWSGDSRGQRRLLTIKVRRHQRTSGTARHSDNRRSPSKVLLPGFWIIMHWRMNSIQDVEDLPLSPDAGFLFIGRQKNSAFITPTIVSIEQRTHLAVS